MSANQPPENFFKDFFEMLDAMIKNKINPQSVFMAGPVQKPRPPCPACGTSLPEIAEMSKMGCGSCYEHFAGEIKPILNYAHGSCVHVGKRTRTSPAARLASLETEMMEAVSREDYERAAAVRDMIKSLKN